jgi:hypothetical protein
MYYLPIIDKYYDQIERSYGDYVDILNNFMGMTVNDGYIYRISCSYMNLGYHRECVDCCEYVIRAYENCDTQIDYGYYFLFLFNLYVCSFYADREKAINASQKIREIVKQNNHAKNIYKEKKSFYDTQLQFIGWEGIE